MAVKARKKKTERVVAKTAKNLGNGTGAVRDRLGEGAKEIGEKVGEGVRDAGAKLGETAREAGKKAGPRVKRARKTIGYRIAGEKPPKRSGKVLLAGVLGAVAAFFLDPISGKRRRHMARDKVVSGARTVAGKVQQRGRYLASTAAGKAEAARNIGEAPPENDQTLAHKVESEVFQSDDIPKGQINVNAENGVVVIRGQVKSPDMINEIERRVRAVQGVRDVRNLLHLPGSPAPTTTETPAG